MKCPICHDEFNPENLVEVYEHEHNGLPVEEVHDIAGVFIGRTFTEQQSGNVKEIRLHREDLSIDVTFHNNKSYRYLDVPIEVMETCKNTASIGSWINRVLKGAYRYYYLNGD